ncbi:MAG TPA: hypoxanthine phosphoribosyltransferase [Halieaceae bacterium]|nr:hypoxanthine phosphoribosyltransferase [Halieaceae bacterium]
MNKHYITPQELLEDSFTLAWQVFESGYRPTYIVGVWRGGTPVGIAVHELLDILGVESDHTAIRTQSYTGIAQRQQRVQVDGMNYLTERVSHSDALLLVDDVHDTGLSLQQIILDLQQACGASTPEIRIATPWFKPTNNQTRHTPDYFVHQTSDWLVFPHELDGLKIDEMRANKPELAPLMDALEQQLKPR